MGLCLQLSQTNIFCDIMLPKDDCSQDNVVYISFWVLCGELINLYNLLQNHIKGSKVAHAQCCPIKIHRMIQKPQKKREKINCIILRHTCAEKL